MTFIVMDELLRRYPNDIIVLLLPDEFDPKVYEKYNFKPYTVHIKSVFYGLGLGVRLLATIKKVDKADVQELESLFNQARIYVDISGYALGSNWGDFIVRYYLCLIHYAHKHHVPVYIMPQSFGPFDYPFPKSIINNWYIHKVLQYPEIIYAREREGYRLLRKKYGLTNIKNAYDMVLMSRDVNPNNIYVSETNKQYVSIMMNSVAIIPNVRLLDKTDIEKLLVMYLQIAKILFSCGKKIYLLHHSGEDKRLAQQVSEYLNENDIANHLLENDFDCIEYEEAVSQFSFIIASRYHAIVHAYRKGVPCVAIGWSVKYRDLLRALKQEQYAFDISNLNMRDIMAGIELLCKESAKEQKRITCRVDKFQRENIFDVWDSIDVGDLCNGFKGC